VSYKRYNVLETSLEKGMIVNGKVKTIKPYGVFIETENGVSGLLYIEDICISRIKSPFERFNVGDEVKVKVKDIDKENNRVSFTYKELLGTWEDNIKDFKQGTVVKGIARDTEKSKNGIFVELKPNLVGLAEYKENVEYGQDVNVYIKKIIPEKKKVKLLIFDE
jgi:small subunit ribosomal protein S1